MMTCVCVRPQKEARRREIGLLEVDNLVAEAGSLSHRQSSKRTALSPPRRRMALAYRCIMILARKHGNNVSFPYGANAQANLFISVTFRHLLYLKQHWKRGTECILHVPLRAIPAICRCQVAGICLQDVEEKKIMHGGRLLCPQSKEHHGNPSNTVHDCCAHSQSNPVRCYIAAAAGGERKIGHCSNGNNTPLRCSLHP